MRQRERGVTLVDVCIAAVIVVIIVGVAYPGFKVANDTISRSGQKARLESAADRVKKAVVSQMRTGQLSTLSTAGVPPFVDIHPPRTGIDLTQITDDGDVPWQADTIKLAFRQTGKLEESKLKKDLNGDGDKYDDFALGVVEVVTPTGTRAITSAGRVILGLPSYEADVNGDGTPDPLFELKDRTFTMRMHLVFRDEKDHYHKASLVHSIYLRNVQE